jgi:anti-sigma B factor antagonist
MNDVPSTDLDAAPPPQGATSADSLAVTTQSAGATTVIALSGVMEMQTVARLRQAVTAAVDTAPAVLVVDLDGVNFVDIAGLAELATVRSRVGESTEVRVVATGHAVLRAIQLAGVDQALRVCISREEALTAR